MLKNYFNVALRNLLKHKFYSLLNILGLSIGLACFMLISLFVKDELSYDQYFNDSDRIHRVDFAATLNGSDIIAAQGGAPMAAALKKDYPEVQDATRIRNSGNWFVRKKEGAETFKEENVMMADSNFFDFFSNRLIYGESKGALNRPNTLVIDLTTSKKIFGNDINPVGEVLVLDNRFDYEVAGVYEDFPQNSHFHHNMILSMSSFQWTTNNNWLSTNFNTYVKLNEGVVPSEFEGKFEGMIETYCAPLIEQYLNMKMDEFRNSGNALGFSLFPLSDIHLKSDKEGEMEANGDIKYVFIFSVVALFILVLACINFMNLSTARSSNRAKEVGVRKVMGAFRKQLIGQFISEAVLISFISFIVAYSLVLLAIPGFNTIAEKELMYISILEGEYVLYMFSIMLVVGLLAGSYPAFYLSMFKPIEVLKGKVRQGVKSGPIRSTLVVFQFSISIIMIIGTAIVFDQLSFIQNKKLGYDKDQILIVNDAWILRDQVTSYKEEASRSANVLGGTVASFTPTSSTNNSDLYFKNPSAAAAESLVINEAVVDYDFFETLGIQMAAGRAFSKDFSSDSSGVLLNEAAVKQFGYETPVGSMLYAYGGSDENPEVEGYRILGVVSDFHFQSLRNDISPLVFHLGERNGVAMFRIQMENATETIAHLNATWEKFAPGQPFDFRFMNKEFDSQYKQEQKIGQIFIIFVVLAIVIACLGLFGLAAFTAEQKTKEIGIRKTLGASVTSIVNLLSRNFIKLVLISFLIAVPVSYLAMDYWLEDFAYRTSLKPLTFFLSGVAAMLIAWGTISYQSWKAARANPVKSLRTE
ncbi:MAG: ABC transporter permease [Cyclobacteriaceae bacterium]